MSNSFYTDFLVVRRGSRIANCNSRVNRNLQDNGIEKWRIGIYVIYLMCKRNVTYTVDISTATPINSSDTNSDSDLVQKHVHLF